MIFIIIIIINTIIVIVTREPACFIISVNSVCMYVSVCQMITFKRLHVEVHICTSSVSPASSSYTGWLNKIPHETICNISETRGLILKILEAA